jgi:hypothetical protein
MEDRAESGCRHQHVGRVEFCAGHAAVKNPDSSITNASGDQNLAVGEKCRRVDLASLSQIHVIADNLSTHKTQAVRTFLIEHPHVQMHFTPTYSSWLNEVELWFSKIERGPLSARHLHIRARSRPKDSTIHSALQQSAEADPLELPQPGASNW